MDIHIIGETLLKVEYVSFIYHNSLDKCKKMCKLLINFLSFQ